MNRLVVIYILLSVTCQYTTGQAGHLLTDTLSVGEVIIRPEQPDGSAGFRFVKIENRLISNYSGEDLGILLNVTTPVFIKNYGPGGLASVSFRGMGANHTQVSWEGIQVNNQMLGQTDFSNIPVSFLEDVTIFFGGSPSKFENPGPGGTISISSKPDWRSGTRLTLSQQLGSYGSYAEGLSLRTGSDKVQYSLKSFLKGSENNFRYSDYFNSSTGEIQRMEDANYNSRGFLQEIYLRKGDVVYLSKLWYTFSDRNLPGAITAFQPVGNEGESDESIRVLFEYNNPGRAIDHDVKVAWVSDWMHYFNNLLDIDSRNRINTVTASANASWIPAESTRINFGSSISRTEVISGNYNGVRYRNRYILDISAEQKIGERIGLIGRLNHESTGTDMLPVSASLGFDIKIFKKRNLHLTGSAGRSNHLPTLNDIYWVPGGNRELNPESAVNSELGIAINEKIFNALSYKTGITIFRSTITDMIVWLPVSGTLWSPENISEVLSRGIEIDQQFGYITGNHDFKLSVSYSYTGAQGRRSETDTDLSPGRQLIYVPENAGMVSLLYQYKDFKATWQGSYTGKRYVTTDNSEWLDPYTLHNLSLSRRCRAGNKEFELVIRADNIFAADYQTVLNYPMPWRSVKLSINLILGKR